MAAPGRRRRAARAAAARACPQMYGVGYPVLERAVGGHYVIARRCSVLLAAKMLATSLTMCDRRLRRRVRAVAVHGRDARLGLRRGRAQPAAARSPPPPAPTAWSAWARCSPAAARAPITAVLIIFELTGDYRIILPLMFAVVVATALSNALHARHDLHAQAAPPRDRHRPTASRSSLMAQITVADAMGTPPRPARPDQPLADAGQAVRDRTLGLAAR